MLGAQAWGGVTVGLVLLAVIVGADQSAPCARAIDQVREQRVAGGTVSLFDFLVAQMLIVRDSGVALAFDGWTAHGRPPRCEVTFDYQADGVPAQLRWTADTGNGRVAPVDDPTGQMSGMD